MKWAVVLLVLPVLLACSAAGALEDAAGSYTPTPGASSYTPAVGSFEPAECSSLSPDDVGIMHDQLYRDLLRGTYGADDCFEFRGLISQSINGGYVVEPSSLGSNPNDFFVRWEGDYQFVEGDLVIVTGASAGSLTFETVIGTERTIPAFYGSKIVDARQHEREMVAARETYLATAQVDYRADYEQRTVEAFEEVQSCSDPILITSLIQNSYNGYLTELNLNFSIGPVPDSFTANTVPNILLEGYYTITPVYQGDDIEYGQVTAVWSGEDCEFENIEINEGIRPTRDPNVTSPTYTPRPTP